MRPGLFTFPHGSRREANEAHKLSKSSWNLHETHRIQPINIFFVKRVERLRRSWDQKILIKTLLSSRETSGLGWKSLVVYFPLRFSGQLRWHNFTWVSHAADEALQCSSFLWVVHAASGISQWDELPTSGSGFLSCVDVFVSPMLQ